MDRTEPRRWGLLMGREAMRTIAVLAGPVALGCMLVEDAPLVVGMVGAVGGAAFCGYQSSRDELSGEADNRIQ